MLPIIGYTSVLSAAPGETVDVMVGSYGASTYRADLRRIICGDTNPDGPGYKDEPVDLSLGEERPARIRKINRGSCVIVPDRNILNRLTDFSIAAVVQPTRLGHADQVVISLPGEFSLGIDKDGCPFADLNGEKSGPGKSPCAIARGKWFLLFLTLESGTGCLTLGALEMGARSNRVSPAFTAKTSKNRSASATDELTIAATRNRDGDLCAHFDGKIDKPLVLNQAVSLHELIACVSDSEYLKRHLALVAAWDFSAGIKTTRIHDLSAHHLDGAIVNAPARAMTGWQWIGQSLCWTERPDLYSAIHFHSSDLYDAGWDADFSVTIPPNLKSGVYAVRLVPDGDEDAAYYCVFAVRPPRDKPSGNTIAFLLPTASYLAYANHRLGLDVPGTEVGMGRLVEIDRHHAFLQTHPEVSYSFYEVHDDDSGVFHSSRLRPIVDMQPKVKGFLGGLGSNLWQFNADTHITGWLDAIGREFDVITDEDLHYDGLSLLNQYNVVITGTHPEYYSERMLDGLQSFTDRGGRLMYLGGNGFYWVISFSEDMPGIIECRRSEVGIRPWEPGHGQFYHAFTGEYGGLWRRNGRAPNRLCGVGMASQGFDLSEPYQRRDAGDNPRVCFMFKGIKNREIGAFGLSGGGAAGLEVDRADAGQGTPDHALIVASSTRHTDIYLMTPEDLLDPTPDCTGTQTEIIRADLTFFETPGGGAVFSTGSIAWSGAMAWGNYQNEIARLTENVLRRFDDPEPFEMPDA